MANTLTNLIPDLYAAIDQVSRELTGLTVAAGRNSTADRAAVGENVRVPITGAANVSDITPAMTTPEPTDQTVGNVPIVITKSRAAEFGFVGESQLGLNNGPGYMSVQADMIAQGVRSLVNEIEIDLAVEAYQNASRSFGAGGTTPFASDLNDTAQLHKILADNGSPMSDKQLVINTLAGANFRTLTQLTNVNQAGDADLLRQGSLTSQPLMGFTVRESAGINLITAGTGTGYVTNLGAPLAEGDTVIAVDTGSGTVLAGDTVTFAGDSNQYVVASSVGGASVTQITIAAPGLLQSLADGVNVTVSRAGSTFTPNLAFNRNALQLVTRAPALPQEGDMAIDRMQITDERSGITFEVSMYPGYRKVRYEIAIAYGVKVIKPEHCIQLLG